MAVVSAVMPVWNAESYVGPAIRSILQQTYDHWELIIVDDGSQDRTVEICSTYQRQDSRIRLIQIPHAGRGAARNRCLDEASGSIVVICDADDLSFPDRFETHAAHFTTSRKVGISTSSVNVVFCDPSDVDAMFYFRFPSQQSLVKGEFAANKMAINHPGSAIARWVFDDYGRYDPRLLRSQDYGLFKRIVPEVEIVITERPLIMYRTINSPFNWPHFWNCKKYHHLADRFGGSLRASENGNADGDLPVRPDTGFLLKSFAQYLNNARKQIGRQASGINDLDRERVLQLLSKSNR